MQDRVRAGLRSSLRSVRPHAGGVANAREAVLRSERAASQRRDAALGQARAQGTRSWQPLHRTPVPARRGAGHAVHFASSDADLVARLTSYVAEGLAAGEHCLVIATPEHRAGLRQSLALSGLQDEARRLLVELDAADVAHQLVGDRGTDRAAFDRVLGQVVRSALATHGRVRAFGEVVGLLHDRGELGAALALERFWDDLQRRLGFPLLCAYLDAGTTDGDDFLGQVCATHTHLTR
jgi:hypothetical protein